MALSDPTKGQQLLGEYRAAEAQAIPRLNIQKLVEDLRKAGIPDKQIDQLVRAEWDRMINPFFVATPGQLMSPPMSGKNSANAVPVKHTLKPRFWMNEPPMTYDNMTNSLTPVGAIFLRMNAQPGMRLPHIEHISAHIVQGKVRTNDFLRDQPTAAIVFIVDDEGTDITLHDEHPHLFPSDNLILRIKMITDK